MNKSEFISAVSDAASLTKVDGAKAVEAFIDVVKKALKKGDRPYVNQTRYTNALNAKPNVVVIKLGTNDSKPIKITCPKNGILRNAGY